MLLLALLLLAGGLRFTGLSWGLRHPVHIDERYFVGSTAAMIRAGDLDHREHRYPGLYFFLLAPGMRWLGPEMDGPKGYLLARAVSASFGVLNVALLYLVGVRLVGRFGGFAGALLLAVMPLDNMISHQVRPETALTTAAVLAIGSFRLVGEELRGDILSGLTLGLAAALKYTAPFLLPSYLASRWLAPGKRLRGALLAVGLMAAVSLLCTPAALLHPVRYFGHTATVTNSYYVGYAEKGEAGGASRGLTTFGNHLAYYLRDGYQALGALGSLLCLAGIVLSLSRVPREWGPILLHPLTTLLVMSTATLVFPRQILQAMPLLCLMAGIAVQAVARWRGWAAVAVTVLAAVAPLRASAAFSRALTRPTSEDLALDWIEAHVPPGSRVLETRPEADFGERPGAAVGVDPKRYEVRLYASRPGPERKQELSLLVPRVAVVITGSQGGGSWAAGLRTVFRAPDDLELRTPEHPVSCAAAEPAGARWTASGLVESGSSRSWTSPGPMRGGEWVQVDFDRPIPLGEVEVLLGNRPQRRPPRFAVATAGEAGRYEVVPSANAHPSLGEEEAADRPPSLLLVLDPVPVRGVRIEELDPGEPLLISAIRLGACGS
jgi:hypothetical protein